MVKLLTCFISILSIGGSFAFLRQNNHTDLNQNTDGLVIDTQGYKKERILVKTHFRTNSDNERVLKTDIFDQLLQEDNVHAKKTRVFVKYKNIRGRRSALRLATKVFHRFYNDGYLSVLVENDALAALKTDENIEKVQIDSIWSESPALEEPTVGDNLDKYLSNNADNSTRRRLPQKIPYAIPMVQADQVSYGKSNAVVCIVDTGLFLHPDLDMTKVNGADRKSKVDGTELSWNKDTRGHGTHVAGTIAAVNNNDYVTGIGPIPLFIVRGLNDLGKAYESDIREALQQCENAPNVKVVNLSLSGASMSDALKTMIDRLYSKNIVIVAASGNDGGTNKNYPAFYQNVVSVGAVSSDENIWKASNHGSAVELVAPGVSIVSLGFTSQGMPSLSTYSGTSMATPVVSGAAAVLFSNFPFCSSAQIRYALAYTAKDKGVGGCDEYYGYGIPQIKTAYDFLSSHPCMIGASWGKSVGDGNCSSIDGPA